MCDCSFDSIPPSTFWLVVALLFFSIFALIDLVNKNKKESDELNTFVHSFNNKDKFLVEDINAAFTRIENLEKKITLGRKLKTELSARTPAPKIKEPVEEDEEDEDDENEE
jgi:hypothetical protein